MPHRLPAAILIQRDKPHPAKQEAICLEYADANGYRVRWLCFHWQDCMGLVLDRAVRAVIAAIDPGPDVADAVERAGATLCVARDVQVRVRRDVHQLVVRMHRSGLDTRVISQILQVDSRDVRRSLWRAGLRPRKPPD